MAPRYRLTSVDTVEQEGSWLFTVRDEHGEETEVVLVPCGESDAPPVEAWVNRCTHEDQRLHREGIGAVTRSGGIVCPKHGSVFDACSVTTAKPPIRRCCRSISTSRTDRYSSPTTMTTYLREGPADDDDDDGPQSTSHLQF